MEINDATLNAIQTWYAAHRNSSTAGRSHYLHYARFRTADHVIYGMDDPQTSYLALMRLTELFKPPAKGNAAQKFRRFIESKLGFYKDGKAWDPHVSNFVLDVEPQDVDLDFNDQDLPLLKRSDRPTATDKERAREAQRKAFTTRYEDSHFGLKHAGVTCALSGAQKNRPEVEDIYDMNYTYAQFKADMKSYAVRRACKFLMYDAISEGKTVVYALDDLNLSAVADRKWLVETGGSISFKTRDQAIASTGFKKVPVCTTEIRELFRCWDYFSGSLKSGLPRVQFMRDFEAVRPPWELQDQRGWSGYAVYLTAKWFENLPDTVQSSRKALRDSVKTLHDGGQYDKAIQAYHGLGIGDFKRADRALPAQV